MSEGRCSEEWDHTASLVAMIASIFARRGKVPDVADFHPYKRREKKDAPKKHGLGVLFAIAKAKGNPKAIAAALRKE